MSESSFHVEDDRLIAYPMYALVCFNCIHFHEFQDSHGSSLAPITCDAFPKEIPEGLLERGEHTTPYPGDHGIQFEPIDKDTPQRPEQPGADAKAKAKR